MNLRVAELFHSVQGEGVYAGTPMHFIRLAGCNVGKFYYRPDAVNWPHDLASSVLANRAHSICTSITGQRFLCDTDYRFKSDVPLDMVASDTWENHVCVTGGEPLIHRDAIAAIVAEFERRKKTVHFETSGTVPIPQCIQDSLYAWVTCSPKAGYLRANAKYINEFKFVVGASSIATDIDKSFEAIIASVLQDVDDDVPVFIQPLSFVTMLDSSSVGVVLDLLQRHPSWRISVQLHKILGVR